MRRLIIVAAMFVSTASWAKEPRVNTVQEPFPDTRWGEAEGGVEARPDESRGPVPDASQANKSRDLSQFMSDVIDVYPIEEAVTVEARPIYKFVCVLKNRLGINLEEPLDTVNYITTSDDRPLREGRPCVYHYKTGSVLGYIRVND